MAGGLPKLAVLTSSGLRLEAASGGPGDCSHTRQASLQPAWVQPAHVVKWVDAQQHRADGRVDEVRIEAAAQSAQDLILRDVVEQH